MLEININQNGEFMKIGKLTLDGYENYGGILQSFALYKFLEDNFTTTDCIWWNNQESVPNLWYRGNRAINWKNIIRYIINWRNYRKDKNNFIKFHFSNYGKYEICRNVRLKRFYDKYMSVRQDVNWSIIKEEYDYFVVGSDQVWGNLTGDNHSKTMLLNFAPPEKRISYAASLPVPQITAKSKEFVVKCLREMKAISVREQQGADFIKELCGREVPVVLDPTMLLNTSDYENLESKPYWLDEFTNKNGKYIITYFLGKRPNKVLRILSEKLQLPIINILDENVYEHYVVSVEEWLYLIHHAELVYTDSFHGTVFSILYRRPFVVCDRLQEGIFNKMTSRIETLLEMTGIEGRRGLAKNDYMVPEPLIMEYPDDLDERINIERSKAYDYLNQALS